MGTLPAVVPVVALSKGVVIGEVVVIVVLVALLVAIIVLNRRRKGSQKAAPTPTPQSYYADLQDSPPVEAPAPGAGSDPLSVGSPAPAAQAAAGGWEPPPPPPPPVAGTPPPGTPAGWLPEPSGSPDTLRYWDGNAWTQHVAKRS
jgi:hypothetical protein